MTASSYIVPIFNNLMDENSSLKEYPRICAMIETVGFLITTIFDEVIGIGAAVASFATLGRISYFNKIVITHFFDLQTELDRSVNYAIRQVFISFLRIINPKASCEGLFPDKYSEDFFFSGARAPFYNVLHMKIQDSLMTTASNNAESNSFFAKHFGSRLMTLVTILDSIVYDIFGSIVAIFAMTASALSLGYWSFANIHAITTINCPLHLINQCFLGTLTFMFLI